MRLKEEEAFALPNNKETTLDGEQEGKREVKDKNYRSDLISNFLPDPFAAELSMTEYQTTTVIQNKLQRTTF